VPAFKLSRRQLAVVAMLINVVVWGAALPISKIALQETTTFHFLLFRFGLAAILSLPILLFYLWRLRPSWQKLGTIILLELLGTSLALGALYLGLDRTSALEASFLTTTLPIFITFGGILFLHERQNSHEWLGLLLAFGGTLFLVFEPLLSGKTTLSEISFWGNVLVLLSNVISTAYYLLAKKYYQKVPKFFVTSVSFWVGTITFFVMSWWANGFGFWSTLFDLQADLALPVIFWPSLYMAIFGSIIGLTVYIIGQDLIEASEASLFNYLHPFIYVPLSMLFFGDRFSLPMILAIGLIGFGVYWGERRLKPRSRLAKSATKSKKKATRLPDK